MNAATSRETGFFVRRWYAVRYEASIKKRNELTRITLFETPFVLYFDGNDRPVCALDVCPHRFAALSDGWMTPSGCIKCPYHGAEFGEEGKCTSFVLPKYDHIARKTRLKTVPVKIAHGFVWIFFSPELLSGRFETETSVPDEDFSVPQAFLDFVDADRGGIQFEYDMDLSWEFMVENLGDASHIWTLHDGSVDPTAKRDKYEGLISKRIEISASPRDACGVRFLYNSGDWAADMYYIFPNIILVKNRVNMASFVVVPIARHRSRMLVRNMQHSDSPWFMKMILQPWLTGWGKRRFTRVLHEDLAALANQSMRLSTLPSDKRRQFVKEDLLTLAFIDWLAKAREAEGEPWCQGSSEGSRLYDKRVDTEKLLRVLP